jgi:hypothetical protein
MIIGEHHPIKRFNGRMYRHLYRNKWLQLKREEESNAYYEGERDDNGRLIRGKYKWDRIIFLTPDGMKTWESIYRKPLHREG